MNKIGFTKNMAFLPFTYIGTFGENLSFYVNDLGFFPIVHLCSVGMAPFVDGNGGFQVGERRLLAESSHLLKRSIC
ncbi:hypothetical protein J3P96_00375 [Pseudomonas sp. R3-56]|uniref:hypothetical protein n=1 Tax=Pseudomonas sp. R3-56 TaxID=2817401 RepID=UPI003DA9EF19